MISPIAPDIFRITVPLPDSPLQAVNCYLLQGPESSLLIDTGFRCTPCREALEAGLRELGVDRSTLDVLATHLHSDHCGLADELAGPGRRVYMGATELATLRDFETGEPARQRRERYLQEGFSSEEIAYILSHNPAHTMALRRVTDAFVPLGDGEVLQAGQYALRVLAAPGHTPGNLMLWEEEHGLLFTGDHVLFDITPNITCWMNMPDALGSYLESLERFRDLPVRLALPGHRESGPYRERVEGLLTHHRERLAESLRIVREEPGLNAYQITGLMRWRIRAENWAAFPPVQKWFAVGEALSHLDYLRLRGVIRREKRGGQWRYEAVT